MKLGNLALGILFLILAFMTHSYLTEETLKGIAYAQQILNLKPFISVILAFIGLFFLFTIGED